MQRTLTTICRLIAGRALRDQAARALARRAVAACLVGWCLAASCLVASWPQAARAQGGDVINREHPLKALFLYNFGSYIEWPPTTFANPEQPFVIGVLGNSPVESTLQEIAASRQINGRRIVIARFATAEAITPCQILFVGGDVPPLQQQHAFEKLRDREVLIVGESQHFALRGGVVNFFIEANKIRFEINVAAARQHHLKISAKLLALARIVDEHAAVH